MYALSMRRFLASIFVLLILCNSSIAADKKKNKFVLNSNPDQWVELAHVADVIAEQKCDNWALAAGLETTLRRQKVELDQRYWILKFNGGLPCLPSAGSFENLKKQIDGEYTLPGPRKVRLEVRYRESLPETTDALLLPLAYGRPYMLWWKDRPFIVKGATWDELIYQTGQKIVEIKTLKLLDPYESGDKHEIVFNRLQDDTRDLSAFFDVVVTELNYD